MTGNAAQTMLHRKHELKRLMGAFGRTVELDVESFSATYSVCELGQCQGMCCYDGVFLEAPEVTVVNALLREHQSRFHSLGIDLTEPVLEPGERESGRKGIRTRRVPFVYRESAALPDHFNRTACVFRCHDGRCALQQLGADLGEDPWSYKPMGCWMHPLTLTLGPRPRLSVSAQGRDTFSACTQCGLRRERGESGYRVFRRELEVLSDILDQDLTPPERMA